MSESQNNIAEFRQAFDIIDKNKDGVITVDDLYELMKSFGQELSHNELKDMIRHADADGNDEVDFTEFMALLTRQLKQNDITDELKSAFQLFDKNGDGFITKVDLAPVMQTLGYDTSSEFLRKLINDGDRDRDGKISFVEFCNLMVGN